MCPTPASCPYDVFVGGGLLGNTGKIIPGGAHTVAVVSDDAVSVVVGTDDTLMANELSQIKEIIYLQTGVDPSNMRISEKIITTESENA